MESLRRRAGLLWMLGLLLVTRLEVLRLRRQVERMGYDPAFGCLTRQGAERRASALRGPHEVVFFDLDDMRRLNARWGYAEVDRRVRAALAAVRVRQADLVVGRWYSGDELFAVVPAGTGVGLCRRLEAALAQEGLSATFGVVLWRETLATSVEAASRLVRTAKAVTAERAGEPPPA
jgi:GGDEF domain-containing protein